MQKFLVHYEGKGEGCDYTIGCNHAISFVEAADLNAAIKQVADDFLAYPDSSYDPDAIDKVTIYAVSREQASFDLEHIRFRRRTAYEMHKAAAQEQADRASYEKLKARYG